MKTRSRCAVANENNDIMPHDVIIGPWEVAETRMPFVIKVFTVRCEKPHAPTGYVVHGIRSRNSSQPNVPSLHGLPAHRSHLAS